MVMCMLQFISLEWKIIILMAWKAWMYITWNSIYQFLYTALVNIDKPDPMLKFKGVLLFLTSNWRKCYNLLLN